MLSKLNCIIVFLIISISPCFAADIYVGELANYTNGAVVDIHAVFNVIPEYQAIQERGLTREDADYYILLARANTVFYNNVRVVANCGNYDLVLRLGSVEAEGLGLTDITQDVVDEIESD